MKWKASFARVASFGWRANTLRLAKWAFKNVPPGTLLHRQLFGSTICLEINRSNAHQLLYLMGERFVAERRLFQPLIATGDTVVEVGANIGYYLLMFEQLVGLSGKLVCFEPDPTNLLELERTISANNFTNVTVRREAVGSQNGQTRFAEGLNGEVLSPAAGQGIEVPMVRLDDAVNAPVNLLTIDVEGYEGHVLFGALELLKRCRPAVFVEIHSDQLDSTYSLDQIVALLKEFYPSIAYYSIQEGSALRRLGQAYGVSVSLAREVDLPVMLHKVAAGVYRSPFWAVCRPSSPRLRTVSV